MTEITVDQFIETQSASLACADLQRVRDRRNVILAKVTSAEARRHHPALAGMTFTLLRALDAWAEGGEGDPLPQAAKEATFAGDYLLRVYDLIPDTVPGLGLADDASIVRRVVARNAGALAPWLPPNVAEEIGEARKPVPVSRITLDVGDPL